ncbi:M23 family metallopeptidase [Novosphingobium lindaniclasticum]|uniref:M23 family metallopeptidase n=1 Tax=Novosphingobium lindaniclasticum TaxID=1329895 RepID=UPI00240A050A|nr:M23 family metallopeptidase [Novosphingobium lindaniclasticum]
MRPHPLLGGMRFHAGIDLAAREGDGVFATAEGRVVQSGWSGGYGLAVTIDHGNGLQTRYAHLSRLGVMAGEDVRSGELVGLVGSTGRSTGPHLHYELRRFGRPIDPSGTLGR